MCCSPRQKLLNRELSSSQFAPVFGLRQPKKRSPRIMLLDEVHTYSGTSGAGVGLLLRRWQRACSGPVEFVGLSATLRNAGPFFARLVGVRQDRVTEVHPTDLVHEGMEYLLALRGDPASRASVLSTTLQATMLLKRILDPSERAWGRAFGQKLFVFTDDLDVTNRLFFNLRDAEGQDSWGNPDPKWHPGGSLANLRASTLPDKGRRFRMGQSWDLCEWLGHRLEPGSAGVRIGRTSSQDSGIEQGSSVIVCNRQSRSGHGLARCWCGRPAQVAQRRCPTPPADGACRPYSRHAALDSHRSL